MERLNNYIKFSVPNKELEISTECFKDYRDGFSVRCVKR
jgi:hypothetical protein